MVLAFISDYSFNSSGAQRLSQASKLRTLQCIFDQIVFK